MDNVQVCELRSIDAWRDQDGWYSNQEFLEGIVKIHGDVSNRTLLRALRDSGYLSADSVGRVAIEDIGDSLEIVARGTREPLYSLSDLSWRTDDEIAALYSDRPTIMIGKEN